MFKGKTIFISALDWGLGHATRCVPVIRELEMANTVIIGVTPLTKTIFESEFPHLKMVDVPAYNISYSRWLPLWFKLVLSWPRLQIVIAREKKMMKNLVSSLKPDVVISDNRFGFYHPDVYTVFITHQLFLKAPIFNKIAQVINKKHVLHFNEVWVPDYENSKESLSGELSHGKHYHPKVKYIGPKSRLKKTQDLPIKYDYLFLLSGPEPQQSILAKKLMETALHKSGLKCAMVSYSEIKILESEIDLYFLPSPGLLSDLIIQSNCIVCRSGYSTLMDLHLLDKKNLMLIPTPGQTEQEYLAEWWKEKFGMKIVTQTNKLHFS